MARKTSAKNTKEPVRLREKELANGVRSLYLDIYVNGKRSYEFLKLYLIQETNPQAKVQNENTMRAANTIKPKVLFPYHYGQTDLSPIPAQLKDIDVRIRHYE